MANDIEGSEPCATPQYECPIRTAQNKGKGSGPIGTMNGKWAFLLKLVLITTPAAWAIFVTVDLPWRVWVTKSTFASHAHIEASTALTQKLDKYIEARERDFRFLEGRIDALPPQEWRSRIQALEDWERENRIDHSEIKIALEAIKAKLDIPPKPDQDGLPYYKSQENRNEQATAARRGGDGPGLGNSDSG